MSEDSFARRRRDRFEAMLVSITVLALYPYSRSDALTQEMPGGIRINTDPDLPPIEGQSQNLAADLETLAPLLEGIDDARGYDPDKGARIILHGFIRRLCERPSFSYNTGADEPGVLHFYLGHPVAELANEPELFRGLFIHGR